MHMMKKSIRWIIGGLLILAGFLELFQSIAAGILWGLAGTVILPPVTKMIPEFKHRKAALLMGCMCLIISGTIFIPAGESTGQTAQNAAKGESTEQTAQNAAKGQSISTDSTKKKSDKKDEKKTANTPKTEMAEKSKDTFDKEELFTWLAETLYGTSSSSEEVEIEKKEKKKWSQVPEKEFLQVWKEVVLEQLDVSVEDYDIVVRDMERAVRLYELVWDSADSVHAIQQSTKELSDKLAANGTLEDKYSFELKSAYQSYNTGNFYITQRLEQSYSENIVGKLEKEIDSYKQEDTSDWIAYDVQYILGTPIAGDNYWVIHADSKNPFSESGAYELTYFDTGKTVPIGSGGGFVKEVPVYQLIENGSQFVEDAQAYAANIGVCSEVCRKIRQELESDSVSNSDSSENAAQRTNLKEGTFKRICGPACSLTVWELDETGVSFSIGIGSSGYLAYVDGRNLNAVWTGDNTAVLSEERYELTFVFQENGVLTLSENHPYNPDFSLAGDFISENLAEETCDFIFPESNVSAIQPEELEGRTAAECKIARNEIYARHGRQFHDEQLQGYFDTCMWYTGTVSADDFQESVLNEIEKANLQTISEYEARMGY